MAVVMMDVIKRLMEPVGFLEQTVDRLLYGDPQAAVTGIVTTFMPTQHVLEEAVHLGANLVIAHEHLFYSHHDAFEDSLKQDPVYLAKKRFLQESGLSVFRNHDYIHRHQPDGITEGLIHALEWEGHVIKQEPAFTVIEFPAQTVGELAVYLKQKLGLFSMRFVGDPDIICQRVGVFVGYRGGGNLVIPLFEQERLDVVIYGEGPEWETPEYVRDAVQQGRRKALLVLGHAESEEWGMRLLANRLQAQFPAIPVHFVRDKPLFQMI
ncbi:Nif3-like dinuclear metal center hexameric protein [Paenibacillus turpanensis]|uniref:Nif3-like dinuclear metal center hexameric protein n=1 Tax=Paenibacillus turpanensis TaxID=2689078 RepID=UPI001408DB3E|nr:Nif3-like dinuclear metal center hexameric protein [Paenibacillus turpanensis]